MKILLRMCLAVLVSAGGFCGAQTPAPPAAVAATRTQLTAVLDAFVKETSASGIACAIKPPKLVVADIPSYGSYDPDTNTLTSPAWEQMTKEEQSIFYRFGGPSATEADARTEFELGVHHWVVVHELGHWWEACRGMVDRGDHYTMELDADRIAAAYWNEHDRAVNAHEKVVFQAIMQRWPNPVPSGQAPMEYFNKNYEALAPTPAYLWFQGQMCLKAFSEMPLPSFQVALGKIKSQ